MDRARLWLRTPLLNVRGSTRQFDTQHVRTFFRYHTRAVSRASRNENDFIRSESMPIDFDGAVPNG